MNDKALELIEKLALKLGTTADQLMDILVKQAYVNAHIEIAWTVFFVVFSVVGLLGIRRAVKMYRSETVDEGVMMSIFFVLSVITIAFSFETMKSISATISCFSNPEYWALQRILEML